MTTEDTIDVQTGWPELPPYEAWQDTCATLLLWTQIIGKIRLRLAPPINHYWGSTLYVTTRGLTTSPIPYRTGTFAIDFDFVAHALRITTSGGEERSFALEPMSVADFYLRTMQSLGELGIHVTIYARPVEMVEAIPFAKDTLHASYDAAAVHRFWRVLVTVEQVFAAFRARFIGKVSPVHLFWGALDLAVTRFSGRTAPKHPGGVPHCANWVMEEAYSHELSSAGFWAGAGLGEAAFYAYAYPSPLVSARITSSRKRLTSTTSWENSSCLTKPCEPQRIHRKLCFRSCKRLTRGPQTWRSGIEAHWNARAPFGGAEPAGNLNGESPPDDERDCRQEGFHRCKVSRRFLSLLSIENCKCKEE